MKENQSRIAFYVIIIITILSFIPLSHLKFDISIDNFFPPKDSDVSFYQRFRESFQSDIDDDIFLIGLENSKGIFQTEFLTKIDSLTKIISKTEHIQKVYSLTNSSFIYFKDNQFNAKPVIHIFQPEFYKEDSINLFESKEYRNLLISKNGKSIAIAAFYAQLLSGKEKDVLLHSLQSKIKQVGFENAHSAAKIKLESSLTHELKKNLFIYLFLLIIIVIGTIYIVYRSYVVVLITIFIIGITNSWTLALMSVFGDHLDLVSLMLPLILVAICVINVNLFLTVFIKYLKLGSSKNQAIETAGREFLHKGIYNLLATAIVFFLLIISDIVPIKLFGIFTGVGVLLSFFMSFVVLKSYYTIYSTNVIFEHNRSNIKVTKVLNQVFFYSIKNKFVLLTALLILIIGTVVYIDKIEMNTKLIGQLPRSNPILDDYKFIEKDFYGSRSFEMALITNDPKNSLFKKDLLKEVDEIETYLKDSCGIGHIISPISLIKGANKAYHGGSNSAFLIPDSQNEINTYFQNIMQTQYADEMKRFILTDGSQLRINGRLADVGAKEFNNLTERFDKFFKEKKYNSQLSYKMTGTVLLMENLASILLKNMIFVIILSFIVISIIAFYIIKSWTVILIVFISNFIPLLFMASIPGAFSITLKPDIVIILPILFSLILGNPLYFLNQFKLEIAKPVSFVLALKRTYLTVGKFMIFSNLIVILIFLGLLSSTFSGLFNIGLLISLGLVFALVLNLTVLPILLIWAYYKGYMLTFKKPLSNLA